MKKRPLMFHRWRWRIIFIAFGLGFMALLFSSTRFPPPASSSSPGGGSTSIPASALVRESGNAPPKIAFLFLARNRLPLEILWDLFLKGAQQNLYSIYVHPRPGFVYDSTNTQSSFFWNRQVNDSILVEWGESSMIDAERILLRKALEDPSISHFVLLSDSCIPLYNFSYIYNYITSSPKSFVDSFTESKKTRYNPRMYPTITQDNWRKGSQWFVLIRKHAEIVIEDNVILQSFYDHCKRDVLPEAGRKYGANMYSRSETDCVPDEHYIQTLLSIHGVENETERRPTTYTLWKASDKGHENSRWHPVTFQFGDVSSKTIRDIQGILSIRYDTEGRTEWCSCNGVLRACYLFARKFTRAAVVRLIKSNETDFLTFAGNGTSLTSLS